MKTSNLPSARAPLTDGGEPPTRPWYNFFRNINTESNAGIQAEIYVISQKLGSPDGTVENIPPIASGGTIVGPLSVSSAGALPGVVTISLQGDTTPTATQYYGTDTTGTRGWYNVADALGACVLADLGDVDATAPVDTYVLTWDAALGKWKPAPGGSGGSPLTTKGDIYAYSTVDARLPVGADTYILAADSTQPTGLKWVAAAGIPDAPSDGQLYARKNGAWVVIPGTSEIPPLSQHYTTQATITSGKLDSGFVDFNDQFVSTAGLTSVRSGATYSTSGGVLTVSQPTSGLNVQAFTEGSSPTTPDIFIEIDVSTKPASGQTNNLYAGLWQNSSNTMGVIMLLGTGTIALFNNVAGTTTYSTGSTSTNLSILTSLKLGVLITATNLVSYIDIGAGWVFLESYTRATTPNLAVPTTLANFKPFFQVANNPSTNGVWGFSRFKSGIIGWEKMRDTRVVVNPDGSPYSVGSEVFFSATKDFPHTGTIMNIMALDMTALTVRQVSSMMFNRSSKLYYDLGAAIIRNSSSSYDIWCGTWGNGFGAGGTIQIEKANTSSDLCAGGRFAIGSLTTLTMPGVVGPNGGAYDPSIWLKGGVYTMAYTITDTTTFAGSPFWPALATSTDGVTWTLSGSNNAVKGYEGTTLMQTNSDVWVLTGGPTTMRIYDSSMAYIGALDAATNGMGNTQPWPAAFVWGSYQYMLTFDGTLDSGGGGFSWGNLIIKRAPRI